MKSEGERKIPHNPAEFPLREGKSTGLPDGTPFAF
jgi:hypothetical protein